MTRVPVTTGASLRRLYRCAPVRRAARAGQLFQQQPGAVPVRHAQLRHGGGAVRLHAEPEFADALFQTGAPTMLTSLEQLELFAKGSDWPLSGKPGEVLEGVAGSVSRKSIASADAVANRT